MRHRDVRTSVVALLEHKSVIIHILKALVMRNIGVFPFKMYHLSFAMKSYCENVGLSKTIIFFY